MREGTESILRISVLFLIGLAVTVGCYICAAVPSNEKGKLAAGAGGQFLLMLVLQLVLQLPPVLYGIFGADASQYTGFNLAEKALPWMWILTLLILGLLTALNRRNLSWTILLPVLLVPLTLRFFHPILSTGRAMEQMAYEMDDYYRALYLLYTVPVLLIMLLALRIKQGKGKYLLGLSLAGLICGIALTAPNVYYVNSTEVVYAYQLGEELPRDVYQISTRGVFVERILEADLFDGSWSVEGYTDGWERITTFSPDDRPYKQVTRYDANGERITGADFQLFGNSRFTEYVIIVDRLLEGSNPGSDWNPEKGNVLCTDASNYEELIAISERNHIGNFRSYYGEQAEVNP